MTRETKKKMYGSGFSLSSTFYVLQRKKTNLLYWEGGRGAASMFPENNLILQKNNPLITYNSFIQFKQVNSAKIKKNFSWFIEENTGRVDHTPIESLWHRNDSSYSQKQNRIIDYLNQIQNVRIFKLNLPLK